VTKDGGPLVHGPTNINPQVGSVWSALQALNVVIGLFSSLAVNMPDFARFSKSTKASTSQILLLPVIGTFGALSPIFVTSAYQKIWGSEFIPLATFYPVCERILTMSASAEYEWFLPAVIASFDSRPIKFFAGFAMMIATLGNQIGQSFLCFVNVHIPGN
jgi:NCS1 family nucleobase:cation symporter-1